MNGRKAGDSSAEDADLERGCLWDWNRAGLRRMRLCAGRSSEESDSEVLESSATGELGSIGLGESAAYLSVDIGLCTPLAGGDSERRFVEDFVGRGLCG